LWTAADARQKRAADERELTATNCNKCLITTANLGACNDLQSMKIEDDCGG
jgi:hypothetical protein